MAPPIIRSRKVLDQNHLGPKGSNENLVPKVCPTDIWALISLKYSHIASNVSTNGPKNNCVPQIRAPKMCP